MNKAMFFILAAVLIAMAGFALRISSSLSRSVNGDGSIVFEHDSYYHLRRAEWTAANYPRMLWQDNYIYYPGMAEIHWPPGYDFVLGSMVKVLEMSGLGKKDWEKALALLNPIISVLTVMLVFRLAWMLFGPFAALVSAASLASSPLHVVYSNFANVDHHGVISLAVVAMAILIYRAFAPGGGTAGSVVAGIFLGLCHLLHPAFIISSFSLCAVLVVSVSWDAFFGRFDEAVVKRFDSFFLSAAIAVFLAAMATPLGRSFGARYEMLSVLHYAVPLSGFFLSRSLLCAAAVKQGRSAAFPLAACFIPAAILCSGLFFTDVTACVSRGLAYALNSAGAITATECLPVLGFGPSRLVHWFSPLFFLVPFAVAYFLSRAKKDGDEAGFAALSYAFTTALAGLLQYSFAPNCAVFLSVFYGGMAAFAAEKIKIISGKTAGIVAFIAVSSVVLGFTTQEFSRSIRISRLDSVSRHLREISTETGGYFDDDIKPEYSVFGNWDFGHVLAYRARRPVIINNFGPIFNTREHYADYARFELATDPGLAAKILGKYGSAYILTRALSLDELHFNSGLIGVPASEFLHEHNGKTMTTDNFRRTMNSRLAHCGGTAFTMRTGLVKSVPYARLIFESESFVLAKKKTGDAEGIPIPQFVLFQVVKGAELCGRDSPGVSVDASLLMKKNTDGLFTYLDSTVAGPDGWWRLRFPYPSVADPRIRTVPAGPLVLRRGGESSFVVLSEADVLEGRKVFVDVKKDR